MSAKTWAPMSEDDLRVHKLLVQFKGGNLEAIGECFKICSNRLYAYGCSLGLDHARADDAVGETFRRAIEHIDRYDDRSGGYAWLATILRHYVYDARPAASRLPDDPPEIETDAEGEARQQELVRCIEEARQQLSDAERVELDRGETPGRRGRKRMAYYRAKGRFEALVRETCGSYIEKHEHEQGA